jgi:hypothetical protein
MTQMGYVMGQLTVEMDDEELAQLEAAARVRRIDPARMTKAQLLKLLAVDIQTKWRPRLSVRRARMALKATQRAKRAKKSAILTLRPNKTHETELVQPSRTGGDAGPLLEPQQGTLAAGRARRLEALMSMQGIWRGDPDKPQDGVAYQREVRAEWQ